MRQRTLPDCLRSVAFARQIVVVDSGSGDETLRDCLRFRLRDQRGVARLRAAKQFAVEQCRENWILVLDADERIPPETARVIRQIIDSPGNINGYSFPRKIFFQGRWIRHAGWWPDRVVRLFRRGQGRLTEAAVPKPLPSRDKWRPWEAPIEHWTEGDLGRIIRKIDRYSTLGAQQAFAEGRRCSIGSACLRAGFTFSRIISSGRPAGRSAGAERSP